MSTPETITGGEIFTEQQEEILQMLGANIPETFQGRKLGKSTREGAGLAPGTLETFPTRTIGLVHVPET